MSNVHVQSGSSMSPVASALLSRLAENWWLLLLRGVAAIAFGVIAFLMAGYHAAVAHLPLWHLCACRRRLRAVGGDSRPRRRYLVAVVARARRHHQHSCRRRSVLLAGSHGTRAADVHRQLGNHHWPARDLWCIPIAQGHRKRVVARRQRSAVDCLRRHHVRAPGCGSTGSCVDNRLVRDLIWLLVGRPGLPTEEIPADLTD